MKFHHDYVCEPNHIRITADSIDGTSKGVKVNFLLNDKVVLDLAHTLISYTPIKEDIDEHVARCCAFLKFTTEDFIQKRFEVDNIMGILNIHRHMHKVRTKSGKVVWSEN